MRVQVGTVDAVPAFDLRAVIEACFARHAPRLTAVAVRLLRNAADAEDAVQDAFVSAWTKRETFEGSSAPGTWIHRIVINACLMKLRSQSRRPAVSLDALPSEDVDRQLMDDASDDEYADHEAIRGELRQRVRAAIQTLSEPHRTILQLRDFEEFTTDQTAEILGISEDAVKTRLCRARRALRERLA
jgi:RNA polymerase sigma-70 factor (ECF subfamily)